MKTRFFYFAFFAALCFVFTSNAATLNASTAFNLDRMYSSQPWYKSGNWSPGAAQALQSYWGEQMGYTVTNVLTEAEKLYNAGKASATLVTVQNSGVNPNGTINWGAVETYKVVPLGEVRHNGSLFKLYLKTDGDCHNLCRVQIKEAPPTVVVPTTTPTPAANPCDDPDISVGLMYTADGQYMFFVETTTGFGGKNVKYRWFGPMISQRQLVVVDFKYWAADMVLVTVEVEVPGCGTYTASRYFSKDFPAPAQETRTEYVQVYNQEKKGWDWKPLVALGAGLIGGYFIGKHTAKRSNGCCGYCGKPSCSGHGGGNPPSRQPKTGNGGPGGTSPWPGNPNPGNGGDTSPWPGGPNSGNGGEFRRHGGTQVITTRSARQQVRRTSSTTINWNGG